MRSEQQQASAADSRSHQESFDRIQRLFTALLKNGVDIDPYRGSMKDTYKGCNQNDLPPKDVLKQQALLCRASHLVEVKLKALSLLKKKFKTLRKYLRAEARVMKKENRSLYDMYVRKRKEIGSLMKREDESCRTRIEVQDYVKAHLEATIALQKNIQACHDDIVCARDGADLMSVWSIDSCPSKDGIGSFVNLEDSSNDVMSINDMETIVSTMTHLLDEIDFHASPSEGEEEYVLL